MNRKLQEILKSFRSSEEGAITVDWVVLTAAVVGMAALALAPIAFETESVTEDTAAYISGVEVGFMSQ